MCDANGLSGKGHDIGTRHGAGSTGSNMRVGIGLARFGEPVHGAEALNLQASQLERRAAEYRTLAEKVKNGGRKDE